MQSNMIMLLLHRFMIWSKTSVSNIFPYAVCELFQDMWLYMSEEKYFNDFKNEKALVWHETNIPYAVWGPQSVRNQHILYDPSEVF